MRLLPALVSLVLAATLFLPVPTGAAAELSVLRDKALALVNKSRAEHDLRPLELTAPLNRAAQAHAEDMLARNYYSHVSPGGDTVMDRYRRAGGSGAKGVAENIARCAACTPPPDAARVERLHEGWMNSAGHRANILGAGYTRFGFGIAVGEDGGLYAVQTFAGPGEAAGEPIGPDRRLAVALETINAARAKAGVSTLEAAQALTESLRRAVPDDSLADFSLDAVGDPMALLPEGSRHGWQVFSVVAGQCGGCGPQATAEDVRRFVEQWMGNGRYRTTLTNPRFTHLAYTLAADGSGRKVAVAMLAGP